ncbi:MAG: hypothetical protein NT118_10295 [Lentisphaerae bacterium]|nr:hypothetical protein [Lentisphaerota bacterium]
MKKRPAVCNPPGSGPLRNPNNVELARPDKIIAFNRCKLFKKQKGKHCKMPCSSITLFSEGKICSSHEAINKIIKHYFYETKYNFEQSIVGEEGMFRHQQDAKENPSRLLLHHDKCTEENFDDFMGGIKSEGASIISEIIVNSRPDDQSKLQMINAGMTSSHVLFCGINDAIKSGRIHYAAELMFYAGRLFERTVCMAYEQYIITGIKNRRHLEGERRRRADEQTEKVEKIQRLIDEYMGKESNRKDKDRTILVNVMKKYNASLDKDEGEGSDRAEAQTKKADELKSLISKFPSKKSYFSKGAKRKELINGIKEYTDPLAADKVSLPTLYGYKDKGLIGIER